MVISDKEKLLQTSLKEDSSVLQNLACFETDSSFAASYCRQCSLNKPNPDDCIFVGWRKLNPVYKTGQANCFLSEKDVTEEDKKLWMPQVKFNQLISASSKVSDLEKFTRIANDIRKCFEKLWKE